MEGLPSEDEVNAAVIDHEYDGILQNAIELSQTYRGSITIQKLLADSENARRIEIFDAVEPSLLFLMRDKYGSRVIERCVEYMIEVVNARVADVMLPNTAELSSHEYGCYVVQKAIEVGEYNFKRAIVDNLAEADVASLLDNKRGCHLLQKVIQHVNVEDVGVVVHVCNTRAPQFVMHPHGCHVLRKIVNKTTNPEAMNGIIRAAINASPDLAASINGNYLLKDVVVKCSEEDRWDIFGRLTSTDTVIREQMKSEYSYYVFEKLLENCNSYHVSMMLEKIKYLQRRRDVDAEALSNVKRLVDRGASRIRALDGI